MNAERLARQVSSAAAFAVPALALTLPSGYSYGAMLLLVGALVFLPLWWRQPLPDRRIWWLVGSFVLMAVVWQLDSWLSHEGWRGADKPLKYLLAIPCLFFLVRFPPRLPFLWAGIGAGAIGGGCVALYQMLVMHNPRPNGFSNAIQYGNLSLLLALMCAIGLFTVRPCAHQTGPAGRSRRHISMVLILVLGAILGTLGSLLSQSRGGWLSLALVAPVMVVVLGRFIHYRYLVGACLAMLVCGMLIATMSGKLVSERIDKVREEVSHYEQTGDAHSSVGQRLAHWKAAWVMGLEKPVLGWSLEGYEAEKRRLVDAGEAHPFILEFNHAHNELLDTFAKRGLLGVVALLLLYCVPLVIFWPRQKWEKFRVSHFENARMIPPQPSLPAPLGLQLMGVLVPVAYLGFGLTQAFLGHNSGTMFYLFMTMLIYSGVHDMAQTLPASQTGFGQLAK